MRGFVLGLASLMVVACGADTPAPETKTATAPPPAEKSAENCTYTLQEATPGWTAYKTTEKAPVSGGFATTTLSPTKAAPSVVGALNGVTMTIDPASVSSGNEGRDHTLREKYFGVFMPKTEFTAGVVAVKGDDQKGTVDLNIGMNGVSKTVAFAYEVAADGTLSANASIEMMDFGLKAAFDSIHEACKLLHTGEDGVSKTWTDVALTVTAKLAKQCS